jgi:hypothetical protein
MFITNNVCEHSKKIKKKPLKTKSYILNDQDPKCVNLISKTGKLARADEIFKEECCDKVRTEVTKA